MTIFQSIILGIIQGATEFLPISSSGHLVVAPYLFGWDIPSQEAFVFDVLVQVATLVAVFAYFQRDLIEIGKAFFAGILARKPFGTLEARMGWLIVLATLPAGLIGLALKDAVESAFSSPYLTALFLLATAGLLIMAERLDKREYPLKELSWKDAVIIGFFQALAIFPGVSRSGATITGGMARQLGRPDAARFSFLLSIPIMLAAGAAATVDLTQIPNLSALLPTYIPGFLAAAVVGYISIRWLLAYLVHHHLYVFSIYLTALAIVTLALIAF